MRYVLKFRTTTNPDETLAHHGIKGQKWGRRRFQNEDGSLTPAGKKRYADDETSSSSSAKNESSSKTHPLGSRMDAELNRYKAREKEIGDAQAITRANHEDKINQIRAKYGLDKEGTTASPEAIGELRAENDRYTEQLHKYRDAREANSQQVRNMRDQLKAEAYEREKEAYNKAKNESDKTDDNDMSDVGVIRDKWSKTDGNKPETGLVPVNKEPSKEKAYDPDEVRDAPKKDNDSNSGPKKKPDVVLDDDDFVDKSKPPKNGKTKTEKEAEEAHKRAEERAKEAEKNRKEEEREKKENAKEREREAKKNLMEEAAEARKKRAESEITDLNNKAGVTRSAGNLSNKLADAYDQTHTVKVPRMDLSKMTNKEMQERIQRESIERQYDQMFNVDRQRAEAGKARVTNALRTAGTLLAVGTAAIELAVALKKYRG